MEANSRAIVFIIFPPNSCLCEPIVEWTKAVRKTHPSSNLPTILGHIREEYAVNAAVQFPPYAPGKARPREVEEGAS